MIAAPVMDRRVETPKGTALQFRPHPGQWRAWQSRSRFLLILAGTQSGKTSFTPWWLRREIQECGPGDYLAVSPSFPLLSTKFFPELRRILQTECGLFKFPKSPKPDAPAELTRRGELLLWGKYQDVPTFIRFGHADNPDSLESMTVKAAVLDEPGQKRFRRQSMQAIRRRLSIHKGRALLTTTPYDLGWLYQDFWQPWMEYHKRGEQHPEIDIVNFRSIDNPVFPKEEYEATRATMPTWAHSMFYDGMFERPAGLIYDAWDDDNLTAPFKIPSRWPRHLGVDFGGVNTAGIFLAEELAPESNQPTGRFFAYREYHAGNLTIGQHAQDLLKGEPMIPHAVGGSLSEHQWRRDFGAEGLPIDEPSIGDVEVGIKRVYAAVKTKNLLAFRDLSGFLDEIGSYARVLNDRFEPTDKIDEKNRYHRLDALRYIGTSIFGEFQGFAPVDGDLAGFFRRAGVRVG